MFKKIERLNRTRFTEYFKVGRRFHSDNFTVVYSPAPLRAVSVVVGKKVHKGAVERNTLRRRVYAALRVVFEGESVTTGTYIIISKPSAKNLERASILPEITSLLATIKKPR